VKIKNSIISTIAASVALFALADLALAQGDSDSISHKRSYVEGTRIKPGSASDTSSVLYQSSGAVGAKGANVFAPKYRDRINTYSEQINLGISKGWLSPESAEHFKSELSRLSALESEATAHQYAQPYLDNVEKEFTQYNIDFTKATNAPALVGNGPAVGPGAAVGSGTKGAPNVAPAASVTTTTKTTTPAGEASIKTKTKVATKSIRHKNTVTKTTTTKAK
jgi:hypothetical protein